MSIWGIEIDIWILEHQADSLKRFLGVIEQYIEKENSRLQELQKEFLEKKLSFDPETGFDPDDYLADLAYEACELEELTLGSFVISALISIEQTLAFVSKKEQKRKGQVFAYNEISGSRGIGQALSYLRKMFDKNEEFLLSPEMGNILNVSISIRNAIVHADAKVHGKETIEKIKDFDNKYPDHIRMRNVDARPNKETAQVGVTINYAKLLLKLHTDLIHAIERHAHAVSLPETTIHG